MEKDYPELPEEIRELLERGEKIDEIRLDKDGNWFHNGQPFSNKKIIDFFNRSINITRDGTYVIHYDRYTYPIIVDDAPLLVIRRVVQRVRALGKDYRQSFKRLG